MKIEYLQQTGDVCVEDIVWCIEDKIASTSECIVHLSDNPKRCQLQAEQHHQHWDKMMILYQSHSHSKAHSLLCEFATKGWNCDFSSNRLEHPATPPHGIVYYLCLCLRYRTTKTP